MRSWGGIATWVVKYRNADTGKRDKRSLGEFVDLAPSQRYDAARRQAEEGFAHLSKGGSTEVVTVKQACENYVPPHTR